VTAPHRFARRLWIGLVVAVTLAVLLLGVFPARTWWRQRAEIAAAQKKLDVLSAQDKSLQQQADALQTNDEIERVARESYGLVKPGEKAFTILPSPTPGGLPAGWPFTVVAGVAAHHG
jgi:cell division protein FtsB